MRLNILDGGADTTTPNFEELVALHYRALYQFAFALTRSEADALDLTQQTFYVWATKGGQLRDVSKAKTWLFTTLHRQFLESRRRHTRFPHFELDQMDAELPTIKPVEPGNEDAAHLLHALAQLDEIYQSSVALFYLEDYPYKEIARVLDLPMGTVKSRITRGLGRLRELMARQIFPPHAHRGRLAKGTGYPKTQRQVAAK